MQKISYMILITTLIFLGCGKPPEAELKNAEQAINSAKAAGAAEWAADTYNSAVNALSQGKSQISAKKYKEATASLIRAANLANSAKSEAPINKSKAEEAERARQAAAEAAAQQSAPEPDRSNTYTVRRGDCLWFIAKRQYNDPYKWSQLYEANTDQIRNPDLIHPNQVLAIP